MKIIVDDWCLRNARQNSPRNCPIALAISNNSLKINYNCNVYFENDEEKNVVFEIWKPTSVFSDTVYLNYEISDDDQIKINKFVKDFDNGKNVKKINFELNINGKD